MNGEICVSCCELAGLRCCLFCLGRHDVDIFLVEGKSAANLYVGVDLIVHESTLPYSVSSGIVKLCLDLGIYLVGVLKGFNLSIVSCSFNRSLVDVDVCQRIILFVCNSFTLCCDVCFHSGYSIGEALGLGICVSDIFLNILVLRINLRKLVVSSYCIVETANVCESVTIKDVIVGCELNGVGCAEQLLAISYGCSIILLLVGSVETDTVERVILGILANAFCREVNGLVILLKNVCSCSIVEENVIVHRCNVLNLVEILESCLQTVVL